MVFQLHPQAYRFASGDVPKLELLPSDGPYARPSNAQAPITVSNLELRLPVHEAPGSLGGAVQPPAPPVVPPGYELASDYRAGAAASAGAPAPGPGLIRLARGRIVATGGALLLRLHCDGSAACSGRVSISTAAGNKPQRRMLSSATYSTPNGRTEPLKLTLTQPGRGLVAEYRRRPAGRKAFAARLAFEDSGHPAVFQVTRRVHLRQARGPTP
jgi:hypothetical protein